MKTKPSVFLSHSSKDKFFVRKLAEKLASHNIKIWLDEAEIKIGDSLTKNIGRAIEDTDYVIVVLSHNSVNSEWVQKELQIAIQKEINKRNVVVLPIIIEPVEIPPFLKDKLYADFTSPDKFDESISKLLKALGKTESKENLIIQNKTKKSTINFESTPSSKRLSQFEDVRIIDLDSNKSYKPDQNKSLYNIYFTLSGYPPEEWIDIFEAERRFPRHNRWRSAWIEGNNIVVYCAIDEVEKYHKPDIEIDVNNTNSKYREYLSDLSRKEIKEHEKISNEKQILDNLKRKIEFE